MITASAQPAAETAPDRGEKDRSVTSASAIQPSLSVITVHYRQPELLRRMLASLNAQNLPFEVIVVNVSPEIEISLPARITFPLRITTAPNRGYAAACNRGLALARGAILAICNTDLEFAPGTLRSVVANLAGHPTAGILAPELVGTDGARQHSARRFYTWPAALWARCPLRGFVRHPASFRRHLMLDEAANGVREIDWAVGAMLFVRRAALAHRDRIFDPRYRLYMEDVDLCWDMWKRGWRVMQAGEIEVAHHYPRSSRRLLSRAGFHHALSFLKFIVKHRGLPERP